DIGMRSGSICRSFISVTADIIPMFTREILPARDIQTRGPAAVIIFVFETRHDAGYTVRFVMVHQVAAYLSAAIAQTFGPAMGTRVEEDKGCGQGRCVKK